MQQTKTGPFCFFVDPKSNLSLSLSTFNMDGRKESERLETHQKLFKILESLNRNRHDLQPGHDPPESDSSAIKSLLELKTASSSILSTYPHHFSLPKNLSKLTNLVQELHNSKTHSLKSFLINRVRSHEITRLATSIESELHALIDIEAVSNLTKVVSEMLCSNSPPSSYEEELLLEKMNLFQERLSRGFDIKLQDLLLKSGVFLKLEWVLCNPLLSKKVREKAAMSIKEVVLFNKDVFVGSVLIGGSVKALCSMGSLISLRVLNSLIRAIRSPLVDEMESCGGIVKIVGYLSSSNDELEMKITATDCIMEIGYYGRKEAVEAMVEGGLIEKLMELQRSEESVDCVVARFAVQLEVGEGLRQREKREFKQKILSKVREASLSEAECATIVAEVLWGSSP